MKLVKLLKRAINRAQGRALVSGITLPIDRTILSPNMELSLASGRYERRERALAGRVIREGDTVLELGAGLGFISAYLRKFTGAGKIVSVEANPHLLPYIKRVHALNGTSDIEVLGGVVVTKENTPKTLPFYCRRDFWASSLDATHPFQQTVHVDTLNLANILAEHRPDVLVMDIEGGELELLSTDSVGSIRTAVIETHPGVYGAEGLAALETHLARLGFHEDREGADRNVRTFVKHSAVPNGQVKTTA